MGFEMENLWQSMKGSHYNRIISRMAEAIRETHDLDEALSAALAAVVDAIPAQTGTLWLWDRAVTGRILPKAVYKGADLSGVSLRPGEGIAGQVIDTGSAVIIRDCQADSRWAGRVDAKTGFQTQSMVCVPLTVGENRLGCIQIINHARGDLFDNKDLTFAQQLAGEVVKLLKEEGLVEDNSQPQQTQKELTLSQLLQASGVPAMERLLSTMPEYVALSTRRQQQVLALCVQLKDCFPSQSGKRFGGL